jgi:hypothetical protein
MAQKPAGAKPMQLSPVLALTVTVPDGGMVRPVCGVTAKANVMGEPTGAGVGPKLVIATEVGALTASASMFMNWSELTPRLSVRMMKAPRAEPNTVGVKDTFSEQLAPGAIGEAERQFWLVVVKGPTVVRSLIDKGAVPLFVTVTVFVPVVPSGWDANVRLDGAREAIAAVGSPVKTYTAPAHSADPTVAFGTPTAIVRPSLAMLTPLASASYVATTLIASFMLVQPPVGRTKRYVPFGLCESGAVPATMLPSALTAMEEPSLPEAAMSEAVSFAVSVRGAALFQLLPAFA